MPAAETGRRILEAVIELHRERFFDQVSLEDIAGRAGVTVQTVIRRFGGKERLFEAAAEEGKKQVVHQRDQAPVGELQPARGPLGRLRDRLLRPVLFGLYNRQAPELDATGKGVGRKRVMR